MNRKLIDPNRSLKQLEREMKNLKVEVHDENHGTKKLNKLLDKAKLMSIDEYGKLELQSRKKEIKQDWKDNAPDMDYTEWLEEQLIFFIDQFHGVNKERIDLIVEKYVKKERQR